ncbi:response regulator [Propionispora vibrioides]|uniref:Two-component system, chemotaxis family, response regulator CheY n=1 Tax=Propionispora vibrioides TaxID=112903 RepID=A0A1H8PMG1_9FIRM|nr:response regulator [Propionispora vibrioides]SEO43162.1 two-component system, chemotaxis family, response regulator CheY [Propionispora vibrioides]
MPRILIVDDSRLFRDSLKKMIEPRLSSEYAEAANGIEALEKHRSFQPDIIFTGIVMPPPDGIALLKIISEIDNKAVLVIISALGSQPAVYKECMTAGAFAVLTKPLKHEMILSVINSIQSELKIGV